MASPTVQPEVAPPSELSARMQAHYRAQRDLRRGICLFNAGKIDDAQQAFALAGKSGCAETSLPAFLAACLISKGDLRTAARQFDRDPTPRAQDTTNCIRRALSLYAAGAQGDAIDALTDGIRRAPEDAELHFQLGTIFAALGRCEEAEPHLNRAITIDRDHTEALVSLALCCGARNAPHDAIEYLQRAQARRPFDARIGLLLAQATKAIHQRGHAIRQKARMPHDDEPANAHGLNELCRLVEDDPDLVDAFLALPAGDVDEQVYAVLLQSLELALSHKPDEAELSFHCGRVLKRLGRREEALRRNERAVSLAPNHPRALIELGKLYGGMNRRSDATQHLERAVASGADYADVHFLLGNLYREEGHPKRAREAYQRALTLNQNYTAAREALVETAR